MSEKNQTRIHMKMNCHITDEKRNNRNKFVKTSLKIKCGTSPRVKNPKNKNDVCVICKTSNKDRRASSFFCSRSKKDEMKNKSENT